MKIYDSEIYGKISEPEKFEELIELLTFEKSEKEHVVHLWRGQSDIAWRIDSTAYRRLKLENREINDNELSVYESHLLRNATHKGYRIKNGILLNDFELLAKLQHHGAATRLLDFTRNSLIALWFCINENINKTGLLIGLNAVYLDGFEMFNEKGEYRYEMSFLENNEYPFTWEPPVVTPRIAAQHSQFIYSSLSNDKRSSIKLSERPDANLFIAISPKLKSQLDVILEKSFDLRYQTLFPDIDGFGNANGHKILKNKMYRW